MTARAALSILLSAMAVSGCQETVGLPVPPVREESRAALLVLAPDSGEPSVLALDLGGEWRRALPPSAFRERLDARWLEFRCPLDRLGLAAGPLTLRGDEGPGVPLPPPLRESSLAVTASPEGGWLEAGASPRPARVEGALRRLDLPADTPCASQSARYFAERLPLPADGRTHPFFAERLADGSVLVGSREGAGYRVRPDGEVDLLGRLATGVVLAAHATASGEVYLFEHTGQLLRGRPGETPVPVGDPFPVETSTDGSDLYAALAGSPDGAELFVQTMDRAFGRFDGERWTVLARGPRPERGRIELPAVAWVEPGHGLTVGVGVDRQVARYRDGALVEERVAPGVELAGLAHVPGVGTLAGGTERGLWMDRGGTWTPVPGVTTAFTRLFAPLGPERFLFAGVRDLFGRRFEFGQALGDAGVCGAEDLTTLSLVVHLEPLGESDLLAASLPFEALAFEPSPDRGFSLIRLARTRPAVTTCGP